MAKTTEELVAAVKQYARNNWHKDGWDIISECWSDEEIAEEIKGCRTEDGAIKKVLKTAKLKEEQRRSVQNEIF